MLEDIVEDDDVQRQSILELIGNSDVSTTAGGTASAALAELFVRELELIVSFSVDENLTVGLRVWTLATPVLEMGLCAGAMYPTLMAKGNSLFPHIAGLTSAILGCALLLVSSAMMGLAGFLSVQVLTPLAVFFVILAFGVVWMVTKLLRHLAQLQPDATMCRNGKVA